MVDVVDTYELAPLQQGMLFHTLSTPGAGVDIEQVVFSLSETLDVEKFEQALRDISKRHPILRTRFRWQDIDEPCQEVLAEAEIAATVADWRDVTPGAAEQLFDAHARADRRHDFDLACAPMMRLFIARFPDGASRVLWTYHHALLDGRSYVMLREWFALYDGALRGETVTLAPSRPYRDYIVWRRSLDLAAAETFWRAMLGDFRVATMLAIAPPGPHDVPDEPFRAAQQYLSRALTGQLRAAADRAQVTVNTMLQAAWSVLLYRYSGESDIVFGATRAGRVTGFSDAEVIAGLFINTLPMRVTIDEDADLKRWLCSLRAQQIALRPYEHTPLTAVHTWSAVARGTPLFESLVVYDHQTIDERMQMVNRHFAYTGQTNFPLALIAYGDDKMLLRLEYATNRFSSKAIARMLTHLTNLIQQLADENTTHLRDLDPVGSAERAALVGEEPIPTFDLRDATLHAGFARQVAATPDAIALSIQTALGRADLSYAELDHRADAVARQLRARGVGAHHVVGLRLKRGLDVVIGILAILRAGGAYLPLDPIYPTQRIAFMLQDAGVRVVLTETALAGELSPLPVECLCLDDPLPPSPAAAPAEPGSGEDPAYVMYTSGSTGQSKGVRVTHRNALRLFAATEAWFGFGPHDVWTLFHSYSFDVSVWEMWGALLAGGRLVIVPQDTSRDSAAFRALLEREKVTVLCQTPTAFRAFIDADLSAPPGHFALRYVIFAGEALALHSLQPWFDRYGDTMPQLINMYGITETTVHASYRLITQADLEAGAGSVIGVPIPDLRIYLLDGHGRPVPTGIAGEIYVAGAGVADGYLQRPELTAQRFRDDPFHGGRMYRSGDLARRLDSGELEYLGRLDQQVKIRGFRIELGEIEAVIARHPAIRHVAVMDRQNGSGDRELVGYLVTENMSPTLIPELRAGLRARLPEYMMPAHFRYIDALPLTSNGKLDRRALPDPEDTRPEQRTVVEPRSATETLVVSVFSELLHRDDVGVFDNFFDLGGHSLLAVRVMARLCDAANVDLPLRNLFERPTPAQLALAIDALSWTAAGNIALPVSGNTEREEFEL